MSQTRSQTGPQGHVDPEIEETGSTLISTESLEEAFKIYDIVIPEGWPYEASHGGLRLHDRLTGLSRLVYCKMFYYGFRLPLHESIRAMLWHHRLNPAQITPSSWCALYAFLRACESRFILWPSLR